MLPSANAIWFERIRRATSDGAYLGDPEWRRLHHELLLVYSKARDLDDPEPARRELRELWARIGERCGIGPPPDGWLPELL